MSFLLYFFSPSIIWRLKFMRWKFSLCSLFISFLSQSIGSFVIYFYDCRWLKRSSAFFPLFILIGEKNFRPFFYLFKFGYFVFVEKGQNKISIGRLESIFGLNLFFFLLVLFSSLNISPKCHLMLANVKFYFTFKGYNLVNCFSY